mmetsp:Transcript_12064/g.27969  ORF Transcript_12064/g.27969 Transcript_12064/m.27969 type:complete len:248 (+) Transcript_12064:672-1415(+)
MAAAVDRLVGASHLATQHEVHHRVRQHLGLDAKILHVRVKQRRANGVRHPSDPNLDARAVRDLCCDQSAHRGIDVRHRRLRQLHGGSAVPIDHKVDLALMDRTALVMRERQLLVHLNDELASDLNDGRLPQSGAAHVVVPVGILWPHLQHGDVDGWHVLPVVVRDLAQIDGNIMHNPLVSLATVISRVVPAEHREMGARRVLLQHGARPQRDARPDLHARQLAPPARKGLVKHIRLPMGDAVVDPVA